MVCVAIGIGLLLLGGGVYLTWWNEANLVCSSGAYEKAAANTKTLETCSINNEILDQFVHLTCPVDESLVVSESSTGISAQGAYMLVLETEQYGYKKYSETESTGRQTCDKNGKCREETRNCSCLELKWSTAQSVTQANFNSISFCNKCPKSNYSSNIPPDDTVWGTTPTSQLGIVKKYADRVPLGDGTLQIDGADIPLIKDQKTVVAPTTPTTISSVNDFELVAPELCGASGSMLMCYKSMTKRVATATSTDITVEAIGDLRLYVVAYGSTTISAIGKKSLNSDGTASITAEEFGESKFPPCKDRNIFYAIDGTMSSSEIYQDLHDSLRTLATILRVVSFVVIFAGFYSVFSPIEDGAEMIPCIGEFVGAIVGCFLFFVSGLLALALWVNVFALAWVFYRPVFGALLLVVGGVFTAAAIYIGRKQVQKKRSRAVDTYPEAKPVDDYEDNYL